MKKAIIGSSICLAILIGGIIGIYNSQYSNNVYESSKNSQVNANAITMMYETDVGSGEYTTSSDSTWLQDGYTFNAELSSCENGSKLTWNDETKQVLLEANVSDKCYVYFDKEPSITLAEYITTKVYTGVDGENNLYYHDGVGSYTNANQEAGDNSYRFSGGDYKVTTTATGAGYTRLYTASNSESDGVINFYCNGSKSYVGATCNASQEYYYTTAYNEATHYDTLNEALNRAVTDGYLTKDNIKNFVCLGSSDCGVDDLYRIIGVFNGQVKLIKYDYADTTMLGTDGDYYETYTTNFFSGMRTDNANHYFYVWNANLNFDDPYADININTWSKSRLNTVNLNTNYWNYLGSEWQSKIAKTTWKVGGNTNSNIRSVSVKQTYTNEIVSPAEATTYQDEIGLMYVSDYMYAVDPSGWTKVGNGSTTTDYRSVKGENWMYMGTIEWTISRCSTDTLSAFGVDVASIVYDSYVFNEFAGVRPVFYLNSDVEFEGGSGTAEDPYRLA